jgi:hypothetical protein
MKTGNASSGWTFFGFFENEEEKEMPDQISFLIRMYTPWFIRDLV